MSTYGPGTFIWTGMDRLEAVLTNASLRATAFLGTSMEDVMEDVFEQSQQEVPVDSGSLRASGHLDPAEVGAGHILLRIGYGARYAWFVHENMAAHHPHGKAKYLEDPMREALSSLTSKLTGRMEGAIMGAGTGPGSRSHAAESSALGGGVNKRSVAQRGGMSREHVESALRQMRSEGGIHQDLRSHFTSRQGKMSRSWAPAPTVHFNYDPTRQGSRGNLQWPGQ